MNIVKTIAALSSTVQISKYSDSSFTVKLAGASDEYNATTLESALRGAAEHKLRMAIHEHDSAARRIAELRAALELDGTHGCDTCEAKAEAPAVQTSPKASETPST
jgi:hypothetical protein